MNLPHRFETVFHPSDFSPESDIAFAHALKIALMSQTTLEVMHVDVNEDTAWDDFPSARETLERWKVLPEGSKRGDVIELGLEIKKVIASSADPVNACLNYLDECQVDLIVLSVHQREGLMRWLGKMVGERISYDSKQSTLFIPVGRQGFVSRTDGSVTLKSILIPWSRSHVPKRAFDSWWS